MQIYADSRYVSPQLDKIYDSNLNNSIANNFSSFTNVSQSENTGDFCDKQWKQLAK